MIDAHQASIFPPQFLVATSSAADGAIRHPSLDPLAAGNIRRWCAQLAVPLEQTVGLRITYGDARTYTDIVELEAPLVAEGAAANEGWIAADAFVTRTPGVAMIVPVADCNAVVYVDPVKNVMALAHIGWHSTVRNLASGVVRYMVQHYGCDPRDILVYNSPSIRAGSYRFTFLEPTDITQWHAEPYATRQPDGTYAIDLVAYNHDQWVSAGVLPEHIEVVDVDTATSDTYPSHFAGQKSRFAVLAMIAN